VAAGPHRSPRVTARSGVPTGLQGPVASAPAQRRMFLPFSPPVIGPEEIDAVVDTLKSAWITTGPKTRAFEREFAAFLGAPGALALNSCTAGLHTALDVARTYRR